MLKNTLSNLETLESEAIHIIREVVAQADNPVMLYSIGKDSSVMVRLAEKAIDNMAVMAKPTAEGGISIVLINNETGGHMSHC